MFLFTHRLIHNYRVLSGGKTAQKKAMAAAKAKTKALTKALAKTKASIKALATAKQVEYTFDGDSKTREIILSVKSVATGTEDFLSRLAKQGIHPKKESYK